MGFAGEEGKGEERSKGWEAAAGCGGRRKGRHKGSSTGEGSVHGNWVSLFVCWELVRTVLA
jgi:hypothetical protein